MGFVKYEVASSPSADVRIGKLGITVSGAALEKHHLGDAEFVNLLWNADTGEIGIAVSDAHDKSAFKIKPRGRTGRDRFIAAGKFYAHFGLNVEGRNATDGRLVDHGGIAAFALKVPQASTPTTPKVGRPRGRRKKEVVVETPAA